MDPVAILDTTFLVALERGGPAQTRLQEIQSMAPPLRIPAIVWVEYLSSFLPVIRSEAVRRLEGHIVLEPFDRTLADAAARLQHDLRQVGRTLGWRDLQVATTALHYLEPLVSNDRVFDGIPGLEWHPH